MNTVYVVEHGLLLEGQESWGISIALVAKHRRKDQLIDKILIRAFDFNDRSVKPAAAPSPSSTFILFALWALLLFATPVFVSVSGYRVDFFKEF